MLDRQVAYQLISCCIWCWSYGWTQHNVGDPCSLQ